MRKNIFDTKLHFSSAKMTSEDTPTNAKKFKM